MWNDPDNKAKNTVNSNVCGLWGGQGTAKAVAS
jgi:hypothetical protein